jgi:hypothetical protein
MNSLLRIYGVLVLAFLPSGLQCQLVSVSGEDNFCKNEKVSPNLTVTAQIRLTGAVFDQTGAPIHFNTTTIQVRDPQENKVLFSAVLDERGQFDLGAIPVGTYRLILFQMKDKKVTR